MASTPSELAHHNPSSDDTRRQFMVEVAWLHYEYGLTQEAVAARYSVSRSTVSRALSEAERLGIVQVTVTEPMPEQARLAEGLRSRYGITAQVGMRVGEENGRAAAARVAARLVERAAALGHISIAASWGRTLALAAHTVRPRRTTGVTVIDAIGHATGDQMASAIDVTSTLAMSLGAATIHIPSPALADSPATHDALIGSSPIEHALEVARSADVTLVSVGVVGETSLLRQENLISPEMMKRIATGGAVGEILGRYYDIDGRAVDDDALLPVGLSLEDLCNGRRVIAVAAGVEKRDALRGALAGQIINELVADDELAESLLAD